MDRRKKQTKQKLFKVLIFVFSLVFFATACLLAVNIWENKNASYSGEEESELESVLVYNGVEYELKDKVETLLVVGLDKFQADSTDSYKNDMQADFLMLIVLDNENETCTALQINRDTICEMNILGVAGERVGTVTQQIALAHTYGNGKQTSCRNVSDAVSSLLMHADIDEELSVTMEAVQTYTDLVGGVTLTVLDDFSGIDDGLVQGTEVTLNGEKALTYVRSRYGMDDSSNNNRMKRQKQFLEALYGKTKEKLLEDGSFVVNAAKQMQDSTVYTCTEFDLQEYMEKIEAYEFLGIKALEGETKKGDKHMEFYPAEESINKIVAELFYSPKE